MRNHSYASALLAASGALLMGLGLYFVFLRPALLPEDLRYLHMSLAEIRAQNPDLWEWLPKVFWVLGGYIFTTGLLTVYVAVTAFRARTRRPLGVLALAGLASIGWMVAVNILLASDYTWLLAGIALLWASGLALAWLEGRGGPNTATGEWRPEERKEALP